MIHVEESRPFLVPPRECDPTGWRVDSHPRLPRRPQPGNGQSDAAQAPEDATPFVSPPPAPFPRIFPGL